MCVMCILSYYKCTWFVYMKIQFFLLLRKRDITRITLISIPIVLFCSCQFKMFETISEHRLIHISSYTHK